MRRFLFCGRLSDGAQPKSHGDVSAVLPESIRNGMEFRFRAFGTRRAVERFRFGERLADGFSGDAGNVEESFERFQTEGLVTGNEKLREQFPVIDAFKAVDDRTARKSNFSGVLFHERVCPDELDGHIKVENHFIARHPHATLAHKLAL